MSYSRCLLWYNCYQTSDMMSIILDVWHQTSEQLYNIRYNIRRHQTNFRQLLSYKRYQISDVISEVWYQTSDMRCLISDNKHHWHQMSDNSYNITYNIRHLITVICQQTSDITRVIADVCFHITVIRCLITVI